MTSASDSTSISTEPLPAGKEAVYSYLLELSRGNYAFSYRYGGKDYRDILNGDYFLLDEQDKAYVLLDRYSTAIPYAKILYEASMTDDGFIELGMAVTGTDEKGQTTFYADTNSSCNLLYAFSTSYGADVLEEKDGEVLSTDEGLVTTLSNLMGLGFLMDEDDPTFYSVSFAFVSADSLSFTLHPYAKYESYFQGEDLTGTFGDVLSASDGSLDAFVRTNPFAASNTLPADKASILDADAAEVVTDVTIVYDDGVEEKDSETIRNYDDERTTTLYQEGDETTRRDYYKAMASDVSDDLLEGGVYERRLEADNTVTKDPIVGVQYEEVGGKPSLYLNDILSGTTKDGENYFYHGYQADAFLTFLTGYNFLNTETLCLTVGEGGIERVEATFGYGNQAYDENLQLVPYHYEAVITFQPHADIPDLQPYEETEESEKVDAVLKNTVSGTYSYTAYDTKMKNDDGTYMRDTTIVSADDVLLLSYGFTGELVGIKGYRKKDENSLVPYEVTQDENGTYVVTALSAAIPGKLEDCYTKLSVAGEVLSYASSGVLTPKDGVKGFYGRIPTYENGKYLVDDSVKIQVDGEGRIGSLTYSFNMFNYFKGVEGVDFAYGEEAFPAELKAAVDAMAPFDAPSSWEEYDAEVWRNMVQYLGEDLAKKVPFLYVYKESKPHVLSVTKGTVYLYFSGDKTDATFVDAYRSYLEGLSAFTKTADGSETVFEGEGLEIRIGKTDYDGIHFCRAD